MGGSHEKTAGRCPERNEQSAKGEGMTTLGLSEPGPEGHKTLPANDGQHAHSWTKQNTQTEQLAVQLGGDHLTDEGLPKHHCPYDP